MKYDEVYQLSSHTNAGKPIYYKKRDAANYFLHAACSYVSLVLKHIKVHKFKKKMYLRKRPKQKKKKKTQTYMFSSTST